MTTARAEVIRASLEAVGRLDFDEVFRLVAPDFEADFSRANGLARGVHTLERFRAVTEEFNSDWESVRYEAHDFIEAGERVVTPFTTHLRGRDGIELQDRGVWVWTFRDGTIARLCLYQELDEALASVGPRE